jgi:hypothetical protein
MVNPNLFILLSGLSIVITADASASSRTVGVLLLLLAVAVDFAVPIAAFVLFGERAKHALNRAKRWMIAHDRQLSIGVLVTFGTVFVVRGVGGLL